MKLNTLTENNNIVLYYPNSSKWVRFKSSDFKILMNNYKQSDLEKYYNIKPNNYINESSSYNSIYILMTNKCNLKCEFCASQKIEDNMGKKNTHDKQLTIKRLEDFVIPYLKTVSFKKIIITGGEPLCNTDFLSICRILSENFGRNKLILETNGLLLDNSVAKEISTLVGKVEISIENVIQNIGLKLHIEKISSIISNAETQLSFSYVITTKNINSLKEALEFCDRNNAYLNYRFVQPFDDKMDNLLLTQSDIKNIYTIFANYLLEIRNKSKTNYNLELIMNNVVPKNYCNAFGKTIAILADGRVTMCVNLQNSKFEVGKIEEYIKIQKNRGRVLSDCKIKKLFNNRNVERCNKCKYSDFCGGLCLSSSGYSIIYDHIECNLRKAMIRYNLFRYSKNNTIKENVKLFLKILDEYF